MGLESTVSADADKDKASATTTVCETKETTAAAQLSGGEKRKSSSDEQTKTAPISTNSATQANNCDVNSKKAKIAMPPAVSSSLTDVDKYKLESPPPPNNTNQQDVEEKIVTSNLMLFGLHPLIKESPLKNMLEDYGKVQSITVRSAFASRYGHVSFEKVDEARKCYVAINGAKLLHKTFLVQPSSAPLSTAVAKDPTPPASTAVEPTSTPVSSAVNTTSAAVATPTATSD